MPKTTDKMPGYDRTFAQVWAETHAMLRNDVRLKLAAILSAIEGLDSTAILHRINQIASEEATRDAKLRELLEAHSTGQLDAEQVVRKMGELLAAER